ncbi:MAG: amidohydrolase family protein [Anaerolineales bacterium]
MPRQTVTAMPVIDADLHCPDPTVAELRPYLPAYWCEYMAQSGFSGPAHTPYPPGAPTSTRADWRNGNGSPLQNLRMYALEATGAAVGILNCSYAVESVHNPDAAAALSTATNEWLSEHWLAAEPRLRASLVVSAHYPELAAKEVDRLGERGGFVQVYLPVHSAVPYGNRRYFPLYEAAARHDLVLGLHFGGAPGTAPTPSGWPSTYIEEVAVMAALCQSQVMSLIAGGVFDQFPTLRVALIECGWAWLPALMWRLDKEWKGIRREVPWVKRLPSEYIHEHIRLTTQPMDAPPNPKHLQQLIAQLGSDDLLMFASDYPHWHADPGEPPFPIELPEPLQSKVMGENARAWYRLAL